MPEPKTEPKTETKTKAAAPAQVKHPMVLAFEARTGREAIDQYGCLPDLIEAGAKHCPVTSEACTLRGVRKVRLCEGRVLK